MDPAAVTHAWHELLHVLSAAILLLTGLPILFLSVRAWSRRPRRPLRRPAGPTPATLYAAATALALGAAAISLMTAARATALPDAVVASTAAALLGATTLHAARRASFAGVTAIPVLGLVGLATLLAIAGPQTSGDAQIHGATIPHVHLVSR